MSAPLQAPPPFFSSQATSGPELCADQGIEGSISAEGEESQPGGRERNGKYSAAHFLDEQAQMERLPEAAAQSESTAGGGEGHVQMNTASVYSRLFVCVHFLFVFDF